MSNYTAVEKEVDMINTMLKDTRFYLLKAGAGIGSRTEVRALDLSIYRILLQHYRELLEECVSREEYQHLVEKIARITE